MDKEREIVDTARSLVSRHGLKKVTIDDIARKAHVSKATVYKYFRNKTEIFDEVVATEARELLSAVLSAAEAEGTSRGEFKAHLLARMERIRQLLQFYRVSEESWGEFWPYLVRLKDWFLDEETAIIRGILQRGIDREELHIERLDLCAHITCATLHTIELPWALEAHGISVSEYADTMIGMLYDGIRKR
jgi:AcrR family transcriptional regulator